MFCHGSIAHGRDAVLARLQADYDYLDAIEHEAREAVAAGRTAEASADALAAMEYPGKHSTEYPMVEIHRQNILRAHGVAVASRSNGKRPAPR